MSSEELEKIIREYIDESIHMSFATCADNHPWVSEVHFVYDNNFNLYFRSKANRRHSEELAKNTAREVHGLQRRSVRGQLTSAQMRTTQFNRECF